MDVLRNKIRAKQDGIKNIYFFHQHAGLAHKLLMQDASLPDDLPALQYSISELSCLLYFIFLCVQLGAKGAVEASWWAGMSSPSPQSECLRETLQLASWLPPF